jgi:alpha-1,6-mannosyltransferase
MTGPRTALTWLSIGGIAMVALTVVALYCESHDQLLWYLHVAPDHLPWFIAAALAQGIIYLGAVLLVLRRDGGRYALVVILGVAAIVRLPVMLSTPSLSNDIYRYIWDGRVQAHGINPYRFVPSDSRLATLRDAAIYNNINRREYARTIYPPLAEMLFFAITRASESIVWMKAAMVAFEALAVWLLIRLLIGLRLSAEHVIIYALNPLALWEFAGNGHVDAAAVAFIALALLARHRERPFLTGFGLGCATMIKFYPALLFPALYRRWDWKMPLAFVATVLGSYAPYLGVGTRVTGFLPVYLKEEGLINGTRFYLADLLRIGLKVQWLSPMHCLVAVGLLLAAATAFVFARSTNGHRSWLVGAVTMATTFSILFSPNNPWYFAWVLPVLCASPYVPMIYLVTASPLLYVTLMDKSPGMLLRINTLLYLSFAMFVFFDLVARRWRGQRFSVIGWTRRPEKRDGYVVRE